MLRGLQEGFVPLLRELKEAGLTLSLDTGFDPNNRWQDGVRDVIRMVHRYQILPAEGRHQMP